MLIKSLLLFVLGAANTVIALTVLARDPRKFQNRMFFLFCVALAGWVIGIGGFLLTQQESAALWWAKAYYSFPLVVALAMPLFSISFPFNDKPSRRVWVPIVIGFLLVWLPLVLSKDFVTAGLVYHEWGKEIVLNKAHYAIYSVYLLSCLGYGLLHTYLKSREAHSAARAQLRFYFFGFTLTSAFGVFFNLILPWFGNYQLIWVGPIFTCALAFAIAYSIIRHRMFDVRLVVARSAAYLASLMAIATMYGFVVFGFSRYVFQLNIPVGVQIAFSAATGIAALAFPGLKRAFDKITNRLFYQDSYDPQVFFDELNRVLVSTTDTKGLLSGTTHILADHLKARYCIMAIQGDKKSDLQVSSTGMRGYPAQVINRIQRLSDQHSQMVVADDMMYDNPALRRILNDNDIAILIPLKASHQATADHLGWITLGPKKSGSLYTDGDIKVLQSVANELIIAIQNTVRFQQIERFNETLKQRVDEATKRLRSTNDKLRALDETKDDFISMASHQLRTPLTSVKGYVSMVLDGDAGRISPLQRKLLNQSFISSQRMVYLISDLLNVSRLRTGRFVVEPVPCNLPMIIQEEVDQLIETARGRNLKLLYQRPERFPALMLDETKMRQVIMNFIDNAIYYTPSGGQIIVTLAEKGSSIEFTVADSGIGVPKSEQHHLFSKFYRAPNAKRARPDGTGLGLFMAKKVIIAQGGAVIFRSQEGKGSTFGFSFSKERVIAKQNQ